MKISSIVVILISIVVFSCAPPPVFNPKINSKNDGVTNDNEISIITYNIQSVFGKGEKKVAALTEYLDAESYDFVLMQEVFDENARNYFVENLDSSFYQTRVPRVDYCSFPSNICQDAGLFSASRFPLVDLTQYDFGENTEITNGAIHQMLIKEFSISFDFMSNKSVLGTLHQVDDSTKLFLFTTHLQAISSKRHKKIQLMQIQAFIENAVITLLKNKIVDSPQNLIVLLSGDFNYDAYDKGDVEIIQQNLGGPRDLYKEFNKEHEEYTLIIKLFGLFRRVDYIFAYDNIGHVEFRKVEIKSINVTDVIDENEESVSDHQALKASLIID